MKYPGGVRRRIIPPPNLCARPGGLARPSRGRSRALRPRKDEMKFRPLGRSIHEDDVAAVGPGDLARDAQAESVPRVSHRCAKDLRDRSARKSLRRPAGKTGASVAHSQDGLVLVGRAAATVTRPPGLLCLIALSSRFMTARASSRRSPRTVISSGSRGFQSKFRPARPGSPRPPSARAPA